MVILGQCHNVSFGRDLQATASADFNIRTFELAFKKENIAENNARAVAKQTELLHSINQVKKQKCC